MKCLTKGCNCKVDIKSRRGYCSSCHTRKLADGTLERKFARRGMPIIDRILEKLVVLGECHIWQGGAVDGQGYAVLGAGKKQIRIHRYVYEYVTGEPLPMARRDQPKKMARLYHTCGNRRCVNIEHLTFYNITKGRLR